MPEAPEPKDRGGRLAVGGAALMVLCCVGHSLLVGVGVAGLASAAGAATGSIAVVAAIALAGLVAMTVLVVVRRRRSRACVPTESRSTS